MTEFQLNIPVAFMVFNRPSVTQKVFREIEDLELDSNIEDKLKEIIADIYQNVG